jgi:nucleoside-diphosphate-sugar epimerase
VPPTPEVVYALAKDLEEEMARQYCRWNPDQKMIGLRCSNVMDPSEYADFPSFENEPASRTWNLWSYIDARDGAQAVVVRWNTTSLGSTTSSLLTPTPS